MDELLYSSIQGYLQWAQKAGSQLKEHLDLKEKCLSKRDYPQMLALVSQQQLPLLRQRVEHATKIIDIIYKSSQLFNGFHVEQFLKVILKSLDDVHTLHIAQQDTLARQAKIVKAVDEQDPAFEAVTFHDVHPTLLHLHKIEIQQHTKVRQLLETVQQHLKSFLSLLYTSHQRLKRINQDPVFLHDSRAVYEHAYLIGLSSSFFSMQYQLHDKETVQLLHFFDEKIIDDPVPLPGELLPLKSVPSHH